MTTFCLINRMSNKGRYRKLQNVSDDEVSLNEDLLDDYRQSTQHEELLTKNVQLKKNVGIAGGVSIVVGSMIGSGIFIVPTSVLQYCNGDMSLSIAVWMVGGIISIFVALCFCELATLIPESGGMAPYLKKIYGDYACFLFLWLFLLTANPQSTSVQIIALGDYISEAIDIGLGICSDDSSRLLSKLIGFTITMCILVCNMTKVKLAVHLQVFCTVGKVFALIIISIIGIFSLIYDSSVLVKNFNYVPMQDGEESNINSSNVDNLSLTSVHGSPGLAGLSLAVFHALWAYDGFDNITCITEEVKNPRKTLPSILIASVLSVMALYLIVNVSYFTVLTEKEMLMSDAVAVSFAAKVHPWLSYVVTFGVCLSLIGSINISFLTTGRMPFVAGRMGFMPELLSMVHIKYFSPVPALLFLTVLASIMVLPSSIDMLLQATVFFMWATRCLCCAGVLVLRYKLADAKRPYKVYKITAVLATVFACYMVLVPLLFNPQVFYLLTFLLVIIFTAVYYLLKKEYFAMTGIGRFSLLVQKLLLVVSSDITSDKKQ